MAGRQAVSGSYPCLVLEDGTVLSITTCQTCDACDEANARSREFVRSSLGDLDIERVEMTGGTLEVSRAQASVPEPAHH